MQGHDIPSRHLLHGLHHRHPCAMSTTLQDVGPHRPGPWYMHQHHHLHIQSVDHLNGMRAQIIDKLLATSALNIVLDIWILVLPLQVLLSIQRPGREKTALLAIFALGGFSCIASIARLYSVRIFTAVSIFHQNRHICHVWNSSPT